MPTPSCRKHNSSSKSHQTFTDDITLICIAIDASAVHHMQLLCMRNNVIIKSHWTKGASGTKWISVSGTSWSQKDKSLQLEKLLFHFISLKKLSSWVFILFEFSACKKSHLAMKFVLCVLFLQPWIMVDLNEPFRKKVQNILFYYSHLYPFKIIIGAVNWF